jgi:L-fuculose-phosphate aldolase
MANYSGPVYPSDYECRKLIIETGLAFYNKSYLPPGSGGISLRSSAGGIWTVPAAISWGQLSHGNLLRINLFNKTSYSQGEPRSGTDVHLKIYREFPEIRAVIHAHPPKITSFAAAGKGLEDEKLSSVFGSAPLIHSADPASAVSYCNAHKAVLLEGFGVVTWGVDLEEVRDRIEALEQLASILLDAGLLLSREIEKAQAGTARYSAANAGQNCAAPQSGGFPSLNLAAQDGCGCGCIPPSCVKGGESGQVKRDAKLFSTSEKKTKEQMIEDVVQSVVSRITGKDIKG